MVTSGMLSVLQHFRESKQEQILLGSDLGTISGRILTEKASVTPQNVINAAKCNTNAKCKNNRRKM